LGINFVIAGIITIIISYLIKYNKVIGFLLSQLKNKIKKQDRFSEWHKPYIYNKKNKLRDIKIFDLQNKINS
jgi:hypothetical protein